ncbi:hypothetical protein NS506_06636 [Nocardia seriolae]|uniref:Uncharacterized protein n=1 Tax=Nocardia seriolae TaxID=37332 RepID=A0ABC8B2L8_9NOCA|nr:hypothetical protein NS506_06636 [Nocardia seriolae]
MSTRSRDYDLEVEAGEVLSGVCRAVCDRAVGSGIGMELW